MASQFSNEQLATLRNDYSKINTIDPSSPTYKALISKLDKMSLDTLRQLSDARIKFISGLAANRVRTLSKKPVAEGNPKTKQWFDAVGAKQKTVADLPTSVDNKRLGRGVVKMTTQKYQDKLMKENSPTSVHAELIQQIAQEVQSMPRVATESEYKAAIRRSLQTKPVIPVSQIESMVQWFIKAHPFSSYRSKPVAEARFDVDHMSGSRGIGLSSVDSNDIVNKRFENYGNYDKWMRDVQRINTELLNDNANFQRLAGGVLATINGVRFGAWSTRNGNGDVDVTVAKTAMGSTTESVTDYSGKLGGNRKSLLSQLSAASTKQQQSDLATQARRAGATQSEIKNATKTLTELSDKVLSSYEKRAQHQKRVATDVANRDDVDPHTWIRATNFAGKRDQGIHRAKSKLTVTEYANDAEHFTRWEDWKYEVAKVGGTTEHTGHGRYTAVGIDEQSFGMWDENTGEGYIDYDSMSNSSLGESEVDDFDTDSEIPDPRNVEKTTPAAPNLDWISKFDLSEIKDAMQKIVDHLADTEDAEKTDLLRNDIRVLDNLHDALRKANGEAVKKCWAIAKSEGSDEHLHDEFIRRMDDALAQSGLAESLHESTFTNKAKWKQAAKQYRVKETDTSSSAFCKDSGELLGRWSNAKSKGWVDVKSSD